ncbi:hypothetical protein BO94DRAFT_549349 [Aspergillus sclerotioniger CBS 115572]|uniref:RNase III domain-containing protein n=1 Tax=Aspergillus sclerotioniger CBS 115572 TaxID=1450535 RepID=A0A317VSM8_9EURO|nr:hypothetical protein BO94DRAFT_549349 [Aspergillus sclerotioniger CBS 115572]PWY76037.1 hypothetical protein BO94DRAFT_549349 [Aspergillus sclerotioniger CBS 115572]
MSSSSALLFEALHAAGFYVPAIYGSSPSSPEEINETIISNASNPNLAATGFEKALDRFVMVNPAQGRTVSKNVMASTVEALIGAVYIDSNMKIEPVRSVIDALDLGWAV